MAAFVDYIADPRCPTYVVRCTAHGDQLARTQWGPYRLTIFQGHQAGPQARRFAREHNAVQHQAPEFTVACEDRQVRHPEPFASLEAAEHFVEWGHGCTSAARHEIREEAGGQLVRVWQGGALVSEAGNDNL